MARTVVNVCRLPAELRKVGASLTILGRDKAEMARTSFEVQKPSPLVSKKGKLQL